MTELYMVMSLWPLFPHPVEQTPCYRNEIRSDKIAPSISKIKRYFS